MTDTANVSRILTLVFTDLADSTGLKTQRRDQAVCVLISRHRAYVIRLAAESSGRIIDWAGDGCFLSFETPRAAIAEGRRLKPDLSLELLAASLRRLASRDRRAPRRGAAPCRARVMSR